MMIFLTPPESQRLVRTMSALSNMASQAHTNWKMCSHINMHSWIQAQILNSDSDACCMCTVTVAYLAEHCGLGLQFSIGQSVDGKSSRYTACSIREFGQASRAGVRVGDELEGPCHRNSPLGTGISVCLLCFVYIRGYSYFSRYLKRSIYAVNFNPSYTQSGARGDFIAQLPCAHWNRPE